MADLEEEWDLLMNGVRKEIADKLTKGEIKDWEAYELLKKVSAGSVLGTKTQFRAWNNSGCSIDTYDGTTTTDEEKCPEGHDPGCGWSSSMGYHCF